MALHGDIPDTLAELQAGIALLPKVASVGTPSPVQSLASYFLTYAKTDVPTLLVELGYDAFLGDRVDQHVQPMPEEACERIALALRRPVAEIIWACGGRVLRAPAPGAGRRTY